MLVAICDDNVTQREYLKDLILRLHKDVNILFYEYDTGEALLRDAGLLHDLIFLDIQLTGIDGIETANCLRKENTEGVLVFISGIYDPTPELIKVLPYRFLKKQYVESELLKELGDILDFCKITCTEMTVAAKDNNGLCRVKACDILYIEKIRSGSLIHIQPNQQNFSGDIKTWIPIVNLYKQLKDQGFEFCHSSYLINFRWVDRINVDTKNVIMADRTSLDITRSRYMAFRKALIKFWESKY